MLHAVSTSRPLLLEPVERVRRRPLGPHARRSGRDATSFDALGPRPADIRCPAELFEGPDDASAGVDLSLLDAVAGAGRVGVVQVVPRLAHGEDREPPDVAGLVAALERTVTHGVADGVD